MVGGPLDTTGELLGKAPVNIQKEPVIEPVGDSLTEKMTLLLLQLKKFDCT